jgi:hypothetical protein
VEDDVLVVVAQLPPGLPEGISLADQPVVGTQEGDVQLGDHEVLVVPRVADQGRAVALGKPVAAVPRQVVEVVLARRPITAIRDLPDLHLVVVARGRGSVDAVELQRRRAAVADLLLYL